MPARLILAVLVAATLTACGSGSSQKVYPLYAPSAPVAETDAAIAKYDDNLPPEGLLAPAGIRTYGNNVIVVDVLAAVPASLAPAATRKTVFTSIFSSLGVSEGAEGKGFTVRAEDGERIELRRFDISEPAHPETKSRLGLMPWLELRPTQIQSGGAMYDVVVLPIVVRTDHVVPIGSRMCVRIDTEHPVLGLQIVREEVCNAAGPMPTAR